MSCNEGFFYFLRDRLTHVKMTKKKVLIKSPSSHSPDGKFFNVGNKSKHVEYAKQFNFFFNETKFTFYRRALVSD